MLNLVMPLIIPEFKPGVMKIKFNGVASIRIDTTAFLSTNGARFLNDVAMESLRKDRVKAEKITVIVREVVGL